MAIAKQGYGKGRGKKMRFEGKELLAKER